jgi:hypothetical protein
MNDIASFGTLADSPLRQEFDARQALFDAQPPRTQRFVETQARALAEAYLDRPQTIRFTLPDRVAVDAQAKSVDGVPHASREQMVGGLLDGLTGTDIRAALRARLAELEGSDEPATAVSSELLRHAMAIHMVRDMLPAGRSVEYVRADDDDPIPTLPAGEDDAPASALMADGDAIVEEGDGAHNGSRGDLHVPYVPYARRFFLPQWVAFDGEGRLLVRSVQEAEAHIASMQRYVAVLHAAVGIAPYVVADEDYQRKRYGILGQLVGQGRALAHYQTQEIVRTIKRRAAANDLNRGLSLSLPYFDDQALEVRLLNFQVIPAGRIMFVPAFVVRAAREEQVKVAQDTRLNPSTRKALLADLALLERSFIAESQRAD